MGARAPMKGTINIFNKKKINLKNGLVDVDWNEAKMLCTYLQDFDGLNGMEGNGMRVTI